MSMPPMGMVRPIERTLRRTSGMTERMVDDIRPMNRSGVSARMAAIMSTKGARSGTKAARTEGSNPRRSFQAGVATPSR